MPEPYDLSADPEPVDELQREMERIARALTERAAARGRTRVRSDDRDGVLRDAAVARRIAGSETDLIGSGPVDSIGSGPADSIGSGPADSGHRRRAERAVEHADHRERLADRLAAQQVDAEVRQSQLLAECSNALPATAIPRLSATTRSPGGSQVARVRTHSERLGWFRIRGRRGTARPGGRRTAGDRPAG